MKISSITSGVLMLTVGSALSYQLLEVNKQLAKFFLSLGDLSYPSKTVRLVFVFLLMAGIIFAISLMVGPFFTLPTSYIQISLLLLGLAGSVFMIFQTLFFYYFADTNFNQND